MKKVRTRIAPSPTGDPHVGTPYMALFNWAFARHHGGEFILRIEDTDRDRSRPGYEKNIFEALKWVGLEWDEGPDIGGSFGPYRQSERTEIYKKYCFQLLEAKKAYKCFTTSEELKQMRELSAKMGAKMGYDRRHRNLSDEEIREREDRAEPYVIRLKVPLTGECVYDDLIKGTLRTPWADVDDQILMKSDGFPTYHLANVVDDHLMEISHVIRGDEWTSSTPKHIMLYEAFGWKQPTFVHMPLLLGTDGKKLSKRKNPTSVFYYRDNGYLPEALMNFLSLMGYTLGQDKEIYSMKELAKDFDFKKAGVSGAIFDTKKLDWLNQHYLINSIPEDQLWNKIKEWSFNDEFMQRLMPLVHTRIKTFSEFMELCSFFFVKSVHPSIELLTPSHLTEEKSALILQSIIWRLDELEDWGSKGLEEASRDIANLFEVNHKKIVMRLLFASICGKHQGPPLFDSVALLGKDRTRARFMEAIHCLGGISKKKLSSLEKAIAAKDCSNFFKEL